MTKSFVHYKDFPPTLLKKKVALPSKDESLLTDEMRNRPRIERARGRFSDQPLPGYQHIAYYYPYQPWYSGERIRVMSWPISRKRVENVEFCYDTIKNPYYIKDRSKLLDDGGPFRHYKIKWIEATVPVTFTTSNGLSYYAYNLFALTGGNHLGKDPAVVRSPPTADLSAFSYSATAWNRARPAQIGAVDLALFLAELRELPYMLSRKALQFTSLGDKYLEVQFGWKPFVSDIIDFLKKVDKLNKTVKFLLSNEGKPLHRSLVIADDKINETFLNRIGYPYTGLPATNEILSGRTRNTAKWYHKGTVKTETKVTFSGVFRYYFDGTPPDSDEVLSRLRGLRVTPETVYNLIPWSWFIDWFTNLGDVISNISASVADSQVSEYAYIMKHTKRTYKWSGSDGYWSPSVYRIFDTKVREKCHPFGLAVSPDSLSPFQASIMAALTDKSVRNKS